MRSCSTSGKKKAAAPYQAFVGHSGAVAGLALHGNTLITADAGDSLLFWRCTPALALPASGTPQVTQDGMPSVALTAAQAARETSRAALAEPQVGGPGAAAPVVTDADEAEPRSTSVVPEYTAAVPAPHPELPARPYGTLPGLPAGAESDQLVGSTAPRMVCDSVVGLCATTKDTMLWLPPQGLLLYAVDNTVVVDDLQSRRQRFLVLSRQPVTCLASVAPNSPVIAAASECAPVPVCYLTP